MNKNNLDLKEIETADALTLLRTDSVHGLTNEEVAKRLERDGYNEVKEERKSAMLVFLKKFWNLNSWLLEIIIIISFLLHHYNDCVIVTILLVLNAILGFIQEHQASKAVEALKNKLRINAKVLRDHIWITIPARELVCGDIVRVRNGDFAPADIKIIQGDTWVNQAALTGESQEIEKKENDVLYASSIIVRSEATGMVTATGTNTYFGRTMQLVQIAKPKLHIEKAISDIIRSLFIVVAGMLVIALVMSYFKGNDLVQIIPLLLVLLLTVVPVALPAMFTITLALGSKKLVKKHVLITRLNALDDAASMDILCVDKTGTITMNQLSITDIVPIHPFREEDVLLFGTLASEAANKDPIDMAFLEEAKRRQLSTDDFKRKKFIPFDPTNRRTEAILENGQEEIHLMKGSFFIVASLCEMQETETKELEEIVNQFASKGYKTMAVAISKNGQRSLVGLAALQDTPHEDSHAAIKELRELGVSIKMLTGDTLAIAREIAGRVGLGQNILKLSDLKNMLKESPEKAMKAIEQADGFAEIYPEDKYLIVRNLQACGHIVGMTGDGINDVLALKQAEVGIATHYATDVAKGAASIVLTQEGLSSMSEPIKVGRMMFQTINTWILQKMIWTVLTTSLVVISLLLTGKWLLSASAALLMLLLTDFGKISLSTDHARWSKKPESRKIHDLAKAGTALAFIVLIEALILLYWGNQYFGLWTNDQVLNTFTFEILFFFATFSIISVRERGHFWESKPSAFLAGALIFDTLAAITLSIIGVPGLKAIPLAQTFFVFLFTLICSLTINDCIKVFLLGHFNVANGNFAPAQVEVK